MFQKDRRIVEVYGQRVGEGQVCECRGNRQQGPQGGAVDGQ